MIPFFDYLQGFREIEPEIMAEISRVLNSGNLVLGEEVSNFELEFAKFTGGEFAVGVNSGTDALVIALRALGVGSGDEVITVSNTAVPTVAAIRIVGATPVFVDVNAATLLMDTTLLESKLSSHTKAIIPVHLFGNAVNMSEVVKFAKQHDLKVIEDCAQAHGTLINGRQVGVFGDIGCFSFYPTKNLGAFGDGGICVTNNPELKKKLGMLRTYGFDESRIAQIEGINSRLDEVQAAILRVKLRVLESALARRRQLAVLYSDGLAGSEFILPKASMIETTQSFHLYVVRTPDRAGVIQKLKSAEIGFGIHYAMPIHLMPGYQFLNLKSGDLPITEQASEQILSLPIFPELPRESCHRVVEALLS